MAVHESVKTENDRLLAATSQSHVSAKRVGAMALIGSAILCAAAVFYTHQPTAPVSITTTTMYTVGDKSNKGKNEDGAQMCQWKKSRIKAGKGKVGGYHTYCGMTEDGLGHRCAAEGEGESCDFSEQLPTCQGACWNAQCCSTFAFGSPNSMTCVRNKHMTANCPVVQPPAWVDGKSPAMIAQEEAEAKEEEERLAKEEEERLAKEETARIAKEEEERLAKEEEERLARKETERLAKEEEARMAKEEEERIAAEEAAKLPDYLLTNKGASSCPSGFRKVSSDQECHDFGQHAWGGTGNGEALNPKGQQLLKKSDLRFRGQAANYRNAGRPKGCFVEKGWSGPYWNAVGGKSRFDSAIACVALQLSAAEKAEEEEAERLAAEEAAKRPDYLLTDKGASSCPSGYRKLSSDQECHDFGQHAFGGNGNGEALNPNHLNGKPSQQLLFKPKTGKIAPLLFKGTAAGYSSKVMPKGCFVWRQMFGPYWNSIGKTSRGDSAIPCVAV